MKKHAVVTGEPAAPKGCTAGSGRGPLEKGPRSGNLASGLPVLLHGAPAGGQVLVRVELHDTVLRIEVHDSGNGTPTKREARSTDAEGRGLLLVSAVADHWGVEERHGPGKCVWAAFHHSTVLAC